MICCVLFSLPVLVFTLNFGSITFCSYTSLFLNTFSSDLTGGLSAILFMVRLFFSPFLHYINGHKWLCDNQCASSCIISGKREAAWQHMFIHCSCISGGMCVEGWTRNVCGQEHAWDTAMVYGSAFQCASLCSGNIFPSLY